MNDEMFAELVGSVREGGAILRGETAHSRSMEVAAPDVKGCRVRRKSAKRQRENEAQNKQR